jgi:hypothetical protein
MTVFSAATFLVFGIYLVFNGVTTDTLIDESEGTASEEQRAEAKATPLKRFVVVTAGVRGFVVRRDWNFAKSGKPAAIFQKFYRSEDPQ